MKHPGLQNRERLHETADKVAAAATGRRYQAAELIRAEALVSAARTALANEELKLESALNTFASLAQALKINEDGLPVSWPPENPQAGQEAG